jgi:hypothetical protein
MEIRRAGTRDDCSSSNPSVGKTLARTLARSGSISTPSAADNPYCSQPAGERVTDSAGEPASVWKTTQ